MANTASGRDKRGRAGAAGGEGYELRADAGADAGLDHRPAPEQKAERRKTLEDPYMVADFEALLTSWNPVAYSINELNRSMGMNDAYPFQLTPAVRGKLHLVHMAILNFRQQSAPGPDGADAPQAAET